MEIYIGWSLNYFEEYSSVNVESVKNVTFDFLNTSHLEENVQSCHSLASCSIIQEDVKNDTDSIINQMVLQLMRHITPC